MLMHDAMRVRLHGWLIPTKRQPVRLSGTRGRLYARPISSFPSTRIATTSTSSPTPFQDYPTSSPAPLHPFRTPSSISSSPRPNPYRHVDKVPGMYPPGTPPADTAALLVYMASIHESHLHLLSAGLLKVAVESSQGPHFLPLYLDFETTGFEKDKEPVEVGILDPVSGSMFDTRMRPHKLINSRATEVHKISNELARLAPKKAEVWVALLAWVTEQCRHADRAIPVFVAHNAAFDFDILTRCSSDGGWKVSVLIIGGICTKIGRC
jgi:hypothetical protein